MLNVYTDTSVIGGCFDVEFQEYSNALFEEFKCGIKHMILSDVVFIELKNAKKEVTLKLDEVPVTNKSEHNNTPEALRLAEAYIAGGALSNKSLNDALHIAIATLSKADVLASWNFKHIVNFNRIKLYNSINLQLGYSAIEIRSPREILKLNDYEKD
jgi:predicted nucleic acid-binding protein